MSLDVTFWTLVITLAAAPQAAPAPCTAAAEAALADAATLVARGDYAAAATRLHGADAAANACPPVRLAAWAARGWLDAAAAADRGGAAESLAPVGTAVEAVDALGPAHTEAGYAVALLRAAAAAAQDERDEMLVWIEEARARSTRLALVGPAPSWPLPIDLAEGELWHGVDDYELAEAAFTRALAARDTALGWRGLARARDRRGNRAGACEAYRRVRQALAGDAAPGSLANEARGYLLLCAP